MLVHLFAESFEQLLFQHQQEFQEDTKDAISLSEYLKKPAQRLDEYVLHLKVRENDR